MRRFIWRNFSGLWLLSHKDHPGHEFANRRMSRWRYFRLAFPRNLSHYWLGVYGVGLKLDPQLQPDVSIVETASLLIGWFVTLIGALLNRENHPELLLGLLFFWISPLWLYTLEPFLYPDMVFEWRAYFSVIGIGLMVSALPLYIGWAIVALWVVQSWRRSHAFQTREAYARWALKENPLAKRQSHNLKLLEDAAMAKEIAKLMDAGLPIPPELLAKHVGTEEFFPCR